MPDISYQMQLLNAARNKPMQNLDTLMNSIGNVWQHREARTDEQDAMKFFMDNPVTPETVQQFSANHPQMPLVDIYKQAGAIEMQKKKQKMKDDWKTLQDAARQSVEKNGYFDTSKISTILPNMDPEMLDRIKELKELHPDVKYFKFEPDTEYQKTVGGRLVGERIKGPTKTKEPSIWIVDDKEHELFVTPETAAALIATGKYQKYEKPSTDKTPTQPGVKHESLPGDMIQDLVWDGSKYVKEGVPYARHKADSAADKAVPIGTVRAVGINLAAKFFPLAKANMGANSEKLSEGLFMTDQFGQNVNEARLRNYLNLKQQESYDWIKIEAERLSKTETPAKAVDMAIKSYRAKFPGGVQTLKQDMTVYPVHPGGTAIYDFEKKGWIKSVETQNDPEHENAAAAIAAGKDPEVETQNDPEHENAAEAIAKVKAMYKKRTGKDY